MMLNIEKRNMVLSWRLGSLQINTAYKGRENFKSRSDRVIEDRATFFIITAGAVTTESFLLPAL